MLKKIRNLDKKDRTMYILRFTLTINIILAIVKYIFAFTLPSMWFFVNAWFLTVLSISRFFLLEIMVEEESHPQIKKERIRI